MNNLPPPPSDLISPRKAARLLDVHVATVYRWLQTGKLQAWKRAGSRWRVSQADVLALLEPVEVEGAGDSCTTRREQRARREFTRSVLERARLG